MPYGITFDSFMRPVSSLNLYLLRELRGVSIITT
jgi:hypothetical protein